MNSEKIVTKFTSKKNHHQYTYYSAIIEIIKNGYKSRLTYRNKIDKIPQKDTNHELR